MNSSQLVTGRAELIIKWLNIDSWGGGRAGGGDVCAVPCKPTVLKTKAAPAHRSFRKHGKFDLLALQIRLQESRYIISSLQIQQMNRASHRKLGES